ncbi:MAG: BMC domain-containing protein, partial [bacterium]
QKLVIPNIDEQLVPALRGLAPVEDLQSLGIVETFSAASTIIAADAAAKKAEVQLIDVRLANALGGKGYFTLTGPVEDVNSAVDAGCDTIKDDGILIERVVIPRPDPALRSSVL